MSYLIAGRTTSSPLRSFLFGSGSLADSISGHTTIREQVSMLVKGKLGKGILVKGILVKGILGKGILGEGIISLFNSKKFVYCTLQLLVLREAPPKIA